MSEDKDKTMKPRVTNRAAEGTDSTAPQGVGKASKAPPTQDRWFDTQLSRMYADLAAEPLPKEMLSLLEKLKQPKEPKP
jgi:hypothetical protein